MFEVACQGIGLSLAAGMLAGALAAAAQGEDGTAGPIGAVLLVIAALGAAFMFGASLETEDHPAWPGWPIGAILAGFAFAVSRDIVAGASGRGGGSAGPIAGIVIIAAVVLAALSLLFGPISLLALIGLVYLALGRRRRAGEKHAGLRSLR